MSNIEKQWRALHAAEFPPAARGQEVNGVDLVLVDTYAAGCIQTFLNTGGLDVTRMQALEGCVDVLERGIPLLSGDTASYFTRLLV